MNNPLLILLLSNPVMQYKESLGLYCIWWEKYQKLIIHQKFLTQTYSTYSRRLPNFVKTQSCWRSKYWTPRRASRSGVAAPDAVMPWCVRVCQRTARPSPKRATSNRVFVIRADKEGGSQRVLRLRMHRTSAHRKRYSTRVRVYHSLRAPAGITVTMIQLYPDTGALSDAVSIRTVSLIKFASRSLPAKVQPKKFFLIAVFFGLHFCKQTSSTYLPTIKCSFCFLQ